MDYCQTDSFLDAIDRWVGAKSMKCSDYATYHPASDSFSYPECTGNRDFNEKQLCDRDVIPPFVFMNVVGGFGKNDIPIQFERFGIKFYMLGLVYFQAHRGHFVSVVVHNDLRFAYDGIPSQHFVRVSTELSKISGTLSCCVFVTKK